MATVKSKKTKTTRKLHGSRKIGKLLTTQFEKSFNTNRKNHLFQNALTQVSIEDLSNNRSHVVSSDHSYSIKLDDWKITSQKKSGRCWMFAALNVIRQGAMEKMELQDFEFSQNYPLFWDKLEKANYFLEAIMETADLEVDDRTVSFLLQNPTNDGGQWNMFVNIVNKYGLVPKSAMPETESSSNTMAMNKILLQKLRKEAKTLRNLKRRGRNLGQVRKTKEKVLSDIYRILSIHLGTPPQEFDWQWRDKKGAFHRDTNMTPQKFAKKYITIPLDDYVCLVHDPRPENPLNQAYTVEYLGNVVEGGRVRYLNVDISTIKKSALQMLKANSPVWFGCDAGKQSDRKLGLYVEDLKNYEMIYNTSFEIDKADRLHYNLTRMNHAMVFTGVDLVKGKPRRWRVENSWGDAFGDKGFFLMTDTWFDEHLFEIAAPKAYLSAKLLEKLKEKPTVLPPWDPMGSLACSSYSFFHE